MGSVPCSGAPSAKVRAGLEMATWEIHSGTSNDSGFMSVSLLF